MSNVIDVATPGAARVFRSIYVPRGAQSMLMFGVGRLAEFFNSLYSEDQSAYGLVRFYTDIENEGNWTPETEFAGGHLETVDQDETGLISQIAFTYRRRADIGWSIQLLFYHLDGNNVEDVAMVGPFMTDFQAVLHNMGIPINVQDPRFANFITESFEDEIDLEDDPAHVGEMRAYYEFRGVPLPFGLDYHNVGGSVYGVWMWCLYDMRVVDPNLSNFNVPPDFPVMPHLFVGGEPHTSIQGMTVLSYENVPLLPVIQSRMGLAIREGGEEYGLGVDEYFLSGNVPEMYTERMYEELREALDWQRIGGVLSSSMRAAIAYASSVNRFT